MKIAIFSPYLETLGGGEKYMLTIAEFLAKSYQVDILLGTHLYDLDVESLKIKAKKLHGLDLTKSNFIKAPLWPGSSFFKRFFFLRKYDYLFYLTDGSIFLSSAKKSIIHFQVPFENKSTSLWQSIKLLTWNKAIFNSDFTKQIVEKSWSLKGDVVYPPVQVELFKSLKKKKQIISVGRFFGFLKDKKHSIMIDVFKDLAKQEKFKGWSLHMIGVAGEGDQEYLRELKLKADGFNIYLHPNVSLDQVIKLYGESAIYWHLMGYGEEDPKKFEHFGITTVESMASGCVPIVINKGGQKEIVEDMVSGFLWDTLEELKSDTLRVISDSKLALSLSNKAQDVSKKFSKESFEKNIEKLIS